MKYAYLSAVLLVSCTQDQAAVVTPAAADASITLAANTASIAATNAAIVEPEQEPDAEPEPEDEPVVGACAVKVPWSSLPRCKNESFVYAAASITGVKELALARSAAADRARHEVFGKAKGTLEGGEVLEVARCGKAMFALSRAPAKNVAPEKKACDAAKLDKHGPPAPGCPAWTSNVVRTDGESIVAVGVARVRNAALAESTALNRARAEIARVNAVAVAKGHSHAQDQGGFSEIGHKKAVCAGNTFVELTAKAIQ